MNKYVHETPVSWREFIVVSEREIKRRTQAVRRKVAESGLGALILFSQVVLGEKAAVRYISNYRLLTRKGLSGSASVR